MRIVNISDLEPAKYNPRLLDDYAFENLKRSIKVNGFIVPVIVNASNNTIIAGHQRTKAAKAIGLESVPAYFIDNITIQDEMLFNQLHNGTDTSKNAIAKTSTTKTGMQIINSSEIACISYDPHIVNIMSKLAIKYGNVFHAVFNDGICIYGANYCKVAELLNIDINATVLNGLKSPELLSIEYGKFYYDHLPKNTYVQCLAQLSRSTEKKEGKQQRRSVLYEEMVLSDYTQEKSILDFGCGYGAYITTLGANAYGIEFYNQVSKKYVNAAKTKEQAAMIFSKIKSSGLFDIAVCDSVLNSVDSVKAEQSVMGTLNALLKLNGTLYISGRSIECTNRIDQRVSTVTDSKIEFLDDNNFTAKFRQGQWYYQHFHRKTDIKPLLESNGFKLQQLHYTRSTWRAMAIKTTELDSTTKTEAIKFEFGLPLPNGKRYDLYKELLPILSL